MQAGGRGGGGGLHGGYKGPTTSTSTLNSYKLQSYQTLYLQNKDIDNDTHRSVQDCHLRMQAGGGGGGVRLTWGLQRSNNLFPTLNPY